MFFWGKVSLRPCAPVAAAVPALTQTPPAVTADNSATLSNAVFEVGKQANRPMQSIGEPTLTTA